MVEKSQTKNVENNLTPFGVSLFFSFSFIFGYSLQRYSVNGLSQPRLQHSAVVKTYVEKPDVYGKGDKQTWLDVSNGKHLEVGTDRPLTSGWGNQV